MITKDKLLENLVEDGYLKTPIIIEAFQKIDRQNFVPENLKPLAYSNEPLPIGQGQTISQPLTVAFMLELLEPKPGEKILDIGSGSGWQTALLAYIVSQPTSAPASSHKSLVSGRHSSVISHSSGFVVAIERILQLKSLTFENVSKYGFIKQEIVEVIWDDGSKGAPAAQIPAGGFDKVIAAASADKIPDAWKNQLKIGGRLVAPVGHSIVVIDKISKAEFKEKEHFGFSFVPLVTD